MLLEIKIYGDGRHSLNITPIVPELSVVLSPDAARSFIRTFNGPWFALVNAVFVPIANISPFPTFPINVPTVEPG